MKLYTKTVCPKCMWVKSELQQARIDFDMINIDEDEEAKNLLISQGILSVPVIEVNGKWVSDVQEILSEIELMSK